MPWAVVLLMTQQATTEQWVLANARGVTVQWMLPVIRMSHLHVKVVTVGGSALGCVCREHPFLRHLRRQEWRVKSLQVLASQGQSSLLTNYLIKSHSSAPCLYARTFACCTVERWREAGLRMTMWCSTGHGTKVNLKMTKHTPKITHGFDVGSHIVWSTL